MATALSSPPSPKKRSFNDMESSPLGQEDQSSTNPTTASASTEPSPEKAKVETTSQNLTGQSRHPSPALSTLSSLSTLTATTPPQSNPSQVFAAASQPLKKRKLTLCEREARSREIAAKKTQKEDEKARKLAEKAKKDEEYAAKRALQDEERRQKNEIKEEKRRDKELKHQQKEQRKREEEEEQQKKQRAQMRMTSFFAKPRSSLFQGETIDASISDTNCSHVPRRRSECQEDPEDTLNAVLKESKIVSDYERTFLPFALPSNATLAPHNRFSWHASATQRAGDGPDKWLPENSHHGLEVNGILASLELAPWEIASRGLSQRPTKNILNSIYGANDGHMDLTDSQALELLRCIPVKFLCFHEDVRPPYVGTLSMFQGCHEIRTLGRNPFRRTQKKELDYDYDSEAEWEEPEEGDEIDTEAGSELESTGDVGEMDDFLDDEADNLPKSNKKLYSDMEPVSSGLCWEDTNGGTTATDLMEYRLEIFSDSQKIPLNPFSCNMWPSLPKAGAELDAPPPTADRDTMRKPLQPIANPVIKGSGVVRVSSASKPGKQTKGVRLLTGDELDKFKCEVEGSDLPKQGLLAVIKKRFPKIPNAVLGDTLSAVAKRVGVREVDKKWVILS